METARSLGFWKLHYRCACAALALHRTAVGKAGVAHRGVGREGGAPGGAEGGAHKKHREAPVVVFVNGKIPSMEENWDQ